MRCVSLQPLMSPPRTPLVVSVDGIRVRCLPISLTLHRPITLNLWVVITGWWTVIQSAILVPTFIFNAYLGTGIHDRQLKQFVASGSYPVAHMLGWNICRLTFSFYCFSKKYGHHLLKWYRTIGSPFSFGQILTIVLTICTSSYSLVFWW